MAYYRWEDPLSDRKGPYNSYNNLSFKWEHNTSNGHPSLNCDDVLWEDKQWIRKNEWGYHLPSDHYFGFSSLEKMNKWFSFTEQMEMLANGIKLVRIPDSQVIPIVTTIHQDVFFIKGRTWN